MTKKEALKILVETEFNFEEEEPARNFCEAYNLALDVLEASINEDLN